MSASLAAFSMADYAEVMALWHGSEWVGLSAAEPVLAESNNPFKTRVKTSRSPCSNWTTAATKPARMKATQILLSTGDGGERKRQPV